jgi:AcrR family transcriptional regulator
MYSIQLCIVTVEFKRRRAVTVERLLDAALATFAELGFQAAGVEDICRRGGFTRGAFYSSFRTKDELFLALFRRETGAMMANLESTLSGFETEADPIAAVVQRCLATFRADRTWELVYIEYTLHASRDATAAAALRAHLDAVLGRLAAMVDDVTTRAGITLTMPAEDFARIVVGLRDGLALQDLPHGGAAPSAATLQYPALLLMLRALSRSQEADA